MERFLAICGGIGLVAVVVIGLIFWLLSSLKPGDVP